MAYITPMLQRTSTSPMITPSFNLPKRSHISCLLNFFRPTNVSSITNRSNFLRGYGHISDKGLQEFRELQECRLKDFEFRNPSETIRRKPEDRKTIKNPSISSKHSVSHSIDYADLDSVSLLKNIQEDRTYKKNIKNPLKSSEDQPQRRLKDLDPEGTMLHSKIRENAPKTSEVPEIITNTRISKDLARLRNYMRKRSSKST